MKVHCTGYILIYIFYNGSFGSEHTNKYKNNKDCTWLWKRHRAPGPLSTLTCPAAKARHPAAFPCGFPALLFWRTRLLRDSTTPLGDWKKYFRLSCTPNGCRSRSEELENQIHVPASVVRSTGHTEPMSCSPDLLVPKSSGPRRQLATALLPGPRRPWRWQTRLMSWGNSQGKPRAFPGPTPEPLLEPRREGLLGTSIRSCGSLKLCVLGTERQLGLYLKEMILSFCSWIPESHLSVFIVG